MTSTLSGLGLPADTASPRTPPTHQRAIAFGLMLAAVVGWAILALQVTHAGPLVHWDDAVAQWAHAHAGPAAIAFFDALSRVHTLPPLALAALGAGGLLWWRGERVWSWLLPLALLGGAFLNMALKEWLQRARPTYSGLAADLHSFSFPSGHAAHATVFYGLLALLAWQTLRWHPAWRALATSAAVAMALLVMAGRVVLGVHYVTDVTAGLLVGIAWLGLLVGILSPAAVRPFAPRH